MPMKQIEWKFLDATMKKTIELIQGEQREEVLYDPQILAKTSAKDNLAGVMSTFKDNKLVQDQEVETITKESAVSESKVQETLPPTVSTLTERIMQIVQQDKVDLTMEELLKIAP